MNEITLHGNVSQIHGCRATNRGDTVYSFDIAIDNGYFDRNRNQWISVGTVFQRVVAYRKLADNAAQTLVVGMTVTVTGKLLDDSYTPQGWDRPLHRTKVQADDIATSLRYATATVFKNNAKTAAAAAPVEFAQPPAAAEPQPENAPAPQAA